MGKHMSIEEFREQGYLQEVNRRLLHPLGVALEATRADGTQSGKRIVLGDDALKGLEWLLDRAVQAEIVTEDWVEAFRVAIAGAETVEPGAVWLTGVTDERDDPEGIYFAEGEDRTGKDGVVLSSPSERRRKRENIDRLWAEREPTRRAALGYMVQELT